MSQVIWKYELPDMTAELSIPHKGEVVATEIDEATHSFNIWVKFDRYFLHEDEDKRIYHVVGTGERVDDDWKYIDTKRDGIYVWHLYEERV